MLYIQIVVTGMFILNLTEVALVIINMLQMRKENRSWYKFPPVNILTESPPCQTHSKAGNVKRVFDTPKEHDSFHQVLNVLQAAKLSYTEKKINFGQQFKLSTGAVVCIYRTGNITMQGKKSIELEELFDRNEIKYTANPALPNQ